MIEGIRLENYQLIEKIASKDIAEYYLAKELTPKGGGKTVVVKRIIPSLADIEEFIAMLVNEARLGMRLDHPNIVKIHHLGEFKNTVFLVQEYIHGHDLKKVIRRGRQARNPIPLEYSVKIISEVCLGLDYAHKQTSEDGHPLNIVHRNISPENILLTFNGEVKLQDFGVAKSADRQSDTIAAVPKGNISYLSPEQIKGETIDRRSDIFSTGIVLWELATGSRLFAMENQYETMRRIKECRVPSPRDLNPYVPAYLEKIVMKALSEKPEERYATAFEFHQALESFLETIPGSVTTRDIGRYLNQLFDAEVPDTDGGDSVIVKLPEELFPEEEDSQELDEEEVASLLSEARALSRQEDPDGIFLSTKKAGKAEVEEREIEFPTPSRPFFEEEEASLEDFGESEEDEALLPPMEQGRLSVPDLPRQEAAFESDRETGTATGEVPTLKIPVSARKGSAKGRGRPGTTPHSVKGAGERETHPATDGETTASVPTIPRHAAPPEAAASEAPTYPVIFTDPNAPEEPYEEQTGQPIPYAPPLPLLGRLQRISNNPYLLSGVIVLLVGAILFLVLLLTDRLGTERHPDEAAERQGATRETPLQRPEFAMPESEKPGSVPPAAPAPYEAGALPYEAEGSPNEAPPLPPPEPSPEAIAEAPRGEHFEFPEHPRVAGAAVRWQPKGRSRANLRYSQPVYIYSTPPGADIYFNGEKAREKTPCAFLLPVPGTYTISIAKDRYIPPAPKQITIRNSRQKIPPISMTLRAIPQEE